MKKLYGVLAIIFLTCSPLSHASTVSSKITLLGGDIRPNEDIEISFNRLLENVVYEVRCDAMTSNGQSKQDIDYIALYSFLHHLQPAINGTPINSNWQATISVNQTNNLSLKNVTTAASSIIIRNLDDTDTISVNNCYAFPQV